MEKTIEIPFGAKDSELKGWEYTIPDNMEAEIKDGKIIVKQKEGEDERIRKALVEFLDELWHLGKNTNFDRWGKADCADWISYLERQKEQKPAEWSEEDKVHLNNAILAAEKEWGAESCTAKFLKSLRPQPHWKPSKEQMKALHAASSVSSLGSYVQDHLFSLYTDLKKLL